MSLINQMLKDLDARHAADVRHDLHREVRTLPAATGSGKRLAVGAAVLLALAAAAFAYLQFGAGELLLPPAPVAAAPTAPAPPAAAPPVAPAGTPGLPADAVPPAIVAPIAEVATDVRAEEVRAEAAPQPLPEPDTEAKPSLRVDTALPRVVSPRRAPAPPRAAPVAATPPLPKPSAASVEKSPAVKSVRERAEADYRNAVTLVGGGRRGDAIDLLLEILGRDGGHVASRQLLARLLIEQSRHGEAMALLAEGLAAQPGQIQWAMTLARLQVDRGELGAAAGTLQASLPFAAANADYQGFAGFVAHRLGRQQESADHYRSATRLAAGEGRWWFGLGLALEAAQQAAEAREAFQRARATGTLNPDLAAIVEQKLR